MALQDGCGKPRSCCIRANDLQDDSRRPCLAIGSTWSQREGDSIPKSLLRIGLPRRDHQRQGARGIAALGSHGACARHRSRCYRLLDHPDVEEFAAILIFGAVTLGFCSPTGYRAHDVDGLKSEAPDIPVIFCLHDPPDPRGDGRRCICRRPARTAADGPHADPFRENGHRYRQRRVFHQQFVADRSACRDGRSRVAAG